MTSKSSSSSLGNVCVIKDATVDHVEGRHIYIVDLDGPVAADKSGYLAPTAKLYGKILTSSALCVVGSILYVFEDEGENEDDNELSGDRKQVYSYDLSSSTSGVTLNLKDGMPETVCTMNNTKFCPCATASPDGKKILVHSSAITPFYEREERCDFELFVVNGGIEGRGECQKLPELRPWDDDSWDGDDENISIISSVFKGGSVVLVLLRTRIYSLDLDSEGCRWEVFARVPWGTPFDIIGEDDVAGARCFSYPELSESEARGPQYPIHLYNTKSGDDDDDEEAAKYFCILHEGSKQVDDFYSIPHYIIDVYRCDAEELKKKRLTQQQEDTLPTTTKLKSLRFSLNKDYTYLLSKCHFTSIPHTNNPAILHSASFNHHVNKSSRRHKIWKLVSKKWSNFVLKNLCGIKL